MNGKLRGLVAATHTPFNASGDLELSAVETQADHLIRAGVIGVFVGGTTGECTSLGVDERLALAERWSQVVRGTSLKLVVHVGSNSIADARTLARQAETIGADAIAAFSPSYFKPKSLDALIAWSGEVARSARSTPFYFYDIPPMTGVAFSMPEFLERATEAVPTLAGIKFSNPDLMAYQQCLRAAEGRFDIPWGIDESLVAALAVGGVGGVGSTYNFAAPIARRVIDAFAGHDLATARDEQYRVVQLVALLSSFGFMSSAKATMGLLGVPVGPARLPHQDLTAEQTRQLRTGLESLGFFQWVTAR